VVEEIMSEEAIQKHIPFTEPKAVTTVQGAEYSESVSPGGLIVLNETKAAPRTSPVATYVPPKYDPKKVPKAFQFGGVVTKTDRDFRSVKMNLLSPEARVIFNRNI
jgi:hypothetical protein